MRQNAERTGGGARAAEYRAARRTKSDLVAVSGVVSDALFGTPSRQMAELHQGDSYAYEFSWQSPSLPHGMGADHTFDISFFQDDFGSLLASASCGAEVLGDHPPRDLAHEMHDAAVRFVTSGDPGWPRFETSYRVVKRFGAEPGAVSTVYPVRVEGVTA